MSKLLNKARLREALELAGSYMEDRGITIEVVGIGGSALLLLGVIERPTQNLDLIAVVESGTYLKLDELPPVLAETLDAVAAHLDLAPDWINTEPSDVMDHGLPIGFADRSVKETYGSLTLHLASRFDQICLKLHATADRGDPKGSNRQTHGHDLCRVKECNDQNGADIIYDGHRQQQNPQGRRNPLAEQSQHAHRKRDIRRHRYPPAIAGRCLSVDCNV